MIGHAAFSRPAASFVLPMLNTRYARCVAIATILLAGPAGAADFDAGQAEDTLERNKCLKCHSIDKKKEGPPYKEVAKKYRSKGDGEKKIRTHLTTAPLVEIDGVEEEHKVIKVKNEAELLNLIRWILAR
jgi:cytochrome c